MFLFKKKEQYIYKVEVHGMMCGSCEAHVNNLIYKNFDVRKVKSNHFKNETIIFSKVELDENKIKDVISKDGYEVKGIVMEKK